MKIKHMVGKCLIIYCKGNDKQYPTLILVDRIEDIEGNLFIVGDQVDVIFGEYNWQGGMETFIAWSSVEQFNIFEDYESYLSYSGNVNFSKKRASRFWFW